MTERARPLIVVVGPTASGKSALAVSLAKRFNGEIISADSRQVYKGMDIGSGKVTKKEMAGVPHHLLDVADPKRTFSASRYATLGKKAIREIERRHKLPIVCGGTGFYVRALVDGLVMPAVKPNPLLRKELQKKTTKELFQMLKDRDPDRAETIDPSNPHRLIRALEIVNALGKVPAITNKPLPHETLFIGISLPTEDLKQKIETRLHARIKRGMMREFVRLHENGVSWKRMESFGLEYKYGALFLQKKIDKDTFVRELTKAIVDYSKRQMTWFRPDPRIHWVKNSEEAIKLTANFLTN